jgi:hypothetical protein
VALAYDCEKCAKAFDFDELVVVQGNLGKRQYKAHCPQCYAILEMETLCKRELEKEVRRKKNNAFKRRCAQKAVHRPIPMFNRSHIKYKKARG